MSVDTLLQVNPYCGSVFVAAAEERRLRSVWCATATQQSQTLRTWFNSHNAFSDFATTSSECRITPNAAFVPRQRLQRLRSTREPNRPAGRPPRRSAFDLPALPGGREEVLWSGSTGMDAGRAAMGHGWPVAACPRSRAGAREPERSEGRTMGRGLFGSFLVLQKGTRRKGETTISVRHKCRICTQRIS